MRWAMENAKMLNILCLEQGRRYILSEWKCGIRREVSIVFVQERSTIWVMHRNRGDKKWVMRLRDAVVHKRSPRILKWVAYPFSSGSSQPRN